MRKAARQPAVVAAPRSRFLAGVLGVSFVLPFAVLLPLMALQVRLGQGYFEYRYSPVRHLRTPRMFVVAIVIAAACGAVWLLAKPEARPRRAGAALLALAAILAGAWAWWAPPSPVNQQFFNATSLSTDGAFVLEAEKVRSAATYLRGFDEVLRRSTREMGGTRVLSNPPGTTMLAYALQRAFPPSAQRWMERSLIEQHDVRPEDAVVIAPALRFSIAWTVIWVLSGVAAYGLGRLFLSPAGAALFAIIVTFNPCTIHFVPGKDPGQLLTINAMLWAWFAGWQRRSWGLSALAGALLVIGSTFGLVHIWVALIALAATAWHDLRGRQGAPGRWRGVAGYIGSAAVGAIAVTFIAYLALGWNIPATLLAVSARWGELQATFEMNRAVWFFIGLPIFLLFLSPGTWMLAALSLRTRRAPRRERGWARVWAHAGARLRARGRARGGLGSRLALSTVAVMLLIYLVMGVTYELPRLWVAFLPPLLLGLAIDSPLLRARGRHPRLAGVLVLIALVQMAFTASHWTLFDAREAEYRLVSQRYFN